MIRAADSISFVMISNKVISSFKHDISRYLTLILIIAFFPELCNHIFDIFVFFQNNYRDASNEICVLSSV